jgi:hypothetical protein
LLHLVRHARDQSVSIATIGAHVDALVLIVVDEQTAARFGLAIIVWSHHQATDATTGRRLKHGTQAPIVVLQQRNVGVIVPWNDVLVPQNANQRACREVDDTKSDDCFFRDMQSELR